MSEKSRNTSFFSTFKPSTTPQSLHTQKKRHLYYEPEKNFWMVMVSSKN